MTIQDELKIYDTLMINYQPGETILHGDLVRFLKSQPEPIVCNDYGFSSPLKFTQSLSFLQHQQNYPHPDAPPRWLITIGERPALTEQQKEEIRREAIRQEITAEQQETQNEPEETADENASLVRLSSQELTESGLPATLNEEILFFRVGAQRNLKRFLLGDPDNQEPLTEDEKNTVFADYAAAYLNGKIYLDRENDNTYMVRLSMKAKDGSPLKINVGKNADGFQQPWYVKYAGEDDSAPAKKRALTARDALKRFAFLGNENDFWKKLSEEVQPESWSFTGKPGDYFILKNYFSYTFARLQQQDKICFDRDGQFAAFNTGLMSRRQGEDLFAYFVPNPGGHSPWKFMCFCSTDSDEPYERACYKNMFAQFNEPPIASYFTKISDLLFDPSGDISISYDHIMRDRIYRFDLDFLSDLCRGYENAQAIINDIREKLEQQKDPEKSKGELKVLADETDALFNQLGELIADSSRLTQRFKDHLDGEVDRACRRAKRNYKYAVPCFYPTRKVMSILLPLTCAGPSDEEEPKPNLVLVCERTVSGDYIGQTVLDLSMAYVDARLLCAPESEWLNPTRIATIPSSPIWDITLADQMQQLFGDALSSIEEAPPEEETEYPEM